MPGRRSPAAGRHQAVRRVRRGRHPGPQRARKGRSSPCWARRAVARRRRCGWSPAWSGRAEHPPRQRGHHAAQAPPAAGQHRLSELRLFPHLDIGENIAVRATRRRGQAGGESERRHAPARPARRHGTPSARAAFKGSNSGSRSRVHRQPATGAAPRRAARCAGSQAAPADAARAQADSNRGGAHLRARHARPGRGHDDGRHDRGHERRPDRADRNPGELYDSPATTFVANFLGQSNLIRGTVTHADGDEVLLDVYGVRVAMPAAAARVGGDAYVGVRPEKIRLVRADDAIAADGENELTGVVTDVSFVGVSTQYLVRTPWGQELTVFAEHRCRRTGSNRRRGAPALGPGAHVRAGRDGADRRRRRCRRRGRGARGRTLVSVLA